MRHESIETTMRYYVSRDANTTADAVWKAYERSQQGTVWGTVARKTETPTNAAGVTTRDKERGAGGSRTHDGGFAI